MQIPRIERGETVFEIEVPDGLRLALVDLEITEASPMAGAELSHRPQRGATGRQRVVVSWSHPVPRGRIAFALRVHASPDGRPPAVRAGLTDPAGHRRIRELVEQDAPIDLTVDGPVAETFRRQIVERGGDFTVPAGHARSLDGGASIVIALAVIAAICIVLGFATFGAVLFMAMKKGYDVDDAGYKVAVGEGSSRQEHALMFKLRQP